MDDAIGLAEALLGLDGFRVLDVAEGPDELVVSVESAAELVGWSRCGVRAEAQDRMRIDIRDLSCFGSPARLVWIKRRWRCSDADCDAKTWGAAQARSPVRGDRAPTYGYSTSNSACMPCVTCGGPSSPPPTGTKHATP